MRSRVAWLLAALVLVACAGLGVWLIAAGHSQRPRLLVGFDDDRLKWTAYPLEVVRRQRSLGADAVRVWVPWNGETRPGTTRSVELSRAEAAARHTTVVLAVFGFGARTPVSAEAQARFCGYARAALALVPDARAVVVWNEANSRTYWRGTPEQYESLLARCYDELHAFRRVQVLDSTASAHAPVAFLDGLAAAYRASGRNRPLVDAFGHNPYPLSAGEPPDAHHAGDVLGEGDYDRLVSTLRAGFAHTAQRSLAIWYLEDGYQSGIPPALRRGYTGRETIAVLTSTVQAERVGAAVRLAACQPLVRAFFNFELVDETRLQGWQSGLIWQGARVKPSAAAFQAAARQATEGTVACAT